MEPIAITGFSFRLPQGAEDESTFWDILVNGKNVMTEWPKSRANIDAFYHSEPNPKNTLSSRGAHFLKGDPGAFDAPFFSTTADEAASMDPQQRWLLEASYRAIENAGIPVEKVAGTDAAVFVGSMSDDYAKLIYKDPDEAPSNTSSGTAPSLLANRLSWYFDLRGPSIQLNTACSSSMIAADLACQCLRSGQASMALVAGSNTILTPEESFHLGNMNFLSPDGRSYSFDHRANGYARGEGVVVLVLKRLGDCLRDGDMIRAVIRASSSNQDGHTPGITQPNATAQENLIRSVYKSGGFDFRLTRYVEAHGTGTKLGDSTEAKALGRVFKTARSPKEPLYIGSVKSNIGHMEGASGLAGILKAVMILERGVIPPNALFEKWNPKINPRLLNIEVPTSSIPWPTQGLRRISVNSFGFGGANAHMILDDAFHVLESLDANALLRIPISTLSWLPKHGDVLTNGVARSFEKDGSVINNNHTTVKKQIETPESENQIEVFHRQDGCSQETKTDSTSNSDVSCNGSLKTPALTESSSEDPGLASFSQRFRLLVWSAKDEAGLERMLETYKRYWEQHAKKSDGLVERLAYTLSARRSLMPWRAYATVPDQPSLDNTKLSPSKGVRSSKETGLAFVFTGQGAQYAKMGLELLAYPVFRNTIIYAGNVLRDLGADWVLLDELEHPEKIHSPEKSQPLCTALQIALVELLQEFGVIPDAVVGHSSGEIVAAYTIGALSLESALRVAYHRGRLSQRLISKRGCMMAVNIAEADIKSYLEKLSLAEDICVACINSPLNVTVSGEESVIKKLRTSIKKDMIYSRKLPVGVAYHSPAMQEIAEDYLLCLGSLQPRELASGNGGILMASSVTGLGTPASAFSKSQYWVDNLVSPVRFADALRYLAIAGPKIDGLKAISTYIEIGPHGALKRPVMDTLNDLNWGKRVRYLPILSRLESPVKSTLETIGQLFAHGHQVSVLSANQQNTDHRKSSFLVDTPEYPFNHSQVYWYETRLSYDWRFRPAAPRTVLGVPVADWNPLEPRWRKILRISDTTWLEDHTIAGDVLFPAAGSMGMALEAVKQMALTSQTITAFRIKEATFLNPIIIRADRDTEVITRLRPLQQGYEKVALRFEVGLFTIVNGNWSECFKSTIYIEYEEPPNDVDIDNGAHSATQAQKHAYAKEKCRKQITKRDFYESLAEQGLQYGKAFSLVEDISWDDQLAIAHVKTEPPVELYEGVVHPGVLDAAFQVCYVAPTDGMSTKLPTTIPYKIRNAWISATGWQYPHTRQIKVLTTSKLGQLGTGIECSINVLSDHGLPLFRVDKLDLRPIVSTESNHETASNLLHRLDWKPDLSFLRPDQLQLVCGINRPVSGSSAREHFYDLEKILQSIFRYNLSPILETDWAKAPPHMKKYVSFLQSHLVGESENPLETSERELNDKLKELVAGRSSWQIFSEVSTNLLSIVRGDIDTSELLLSTALAQNYCEDLLSSFDDHDKLQSYLELAVHQNPGLRILEIGGGSGAMTNLVLSMLDRIEQRVGGVAYSEYTFTDQSESNCQQARERFGNLYSRMKFKAFDIFQARHPGQDTKSQSFKPTEFDVILARGALHTSRNLLAKLLDLRRILKLGGNLVFCEATIPDDFAMNFALGVLPDWWQESLLTTSNSDALLKENGFSGHDMVIRDSVSHPLSIVVSTAIDLTHETIDSVQTFLVVQEKDEYQTAIALALIRDTFNSSEHQPLIISLTEIPDTQIGPMDHVLFLADMGKSTGSLLADMSDATFQRIRSLVQRSSNILWISSSGKGPFLDSGLDPYFGIKDGFLRTLRSEFSAKRIISLTLEISPLNTSATISQISKVYASAFIQKSPELEYVEERGQILTSRLVGDTHLNYELSSSIRPETRSASWLPGPPLKLDIGRRGQLDTLRFVEDVAYYEELGPTDVEIEAKAWSVNFRDVFSALGRLDDPGFGLDCAGIVTRVGAKCRSVQPGDRVCMCVVDCMRMYPRSDEKVVAKIPPSLTFEEACAFALPTLTAWYSLIEIARVGQGDKVLIHAAAGATGQLAIQIAQNAGAEVFATVGYAHKKQLLIDHYGIPAEHIFYSRSDNVTFAQGVMRATHGYGVDVVLNSLVGEGLRASWECVAPYGRFIEIGKVDINENSSLPMAPFAANANFASVDIRHMLLHRRQHVKKLLDQMMTMIADGSIQYPKPLHTYDVSAIEDVFRYIQSGKNSGRTVIRIESNSKVQKHLITRRSWQFDENASYLVAGGLGGIGRSILKWMASRGAKNLIIPSRSGPASNSAAQAVRELEEKGVKITTPKCDVSSYTSLSQTLEECAKTLPPIKGCINASMVLNDSIFENMSFSQWDNTIQSKVATSWNLHSLLPTDPEFMIFLSSVSGIIGNQGQSNYAAGCTFQDSLAQFRARRGKKTVSIDLGAMRTIGVIAESEALQNHFNGGTKGLGQVEEYELLALLDIICDPAVNIDTAPSQIVMGIGVPAEFLARSLEPPETMQRPLFAYFNQASSSSSDSIANFAVQFRQAETAADRSSLVTHSLATRLARALSINPEDIDTGKPLHAFGVDSLVAVELRNWLAKEFLAEVPVSELVGRRTVEDVGELVEKSSQIRIIE